LKAVKKTVIALCDPETSISVAGKGPSHKKDEFPDNISMFDRLWTLTNPLYRQKLWTMIEF